MMISPVLGRVTVALSGPQARAWCQGHGFQGTCEGDYKPGKGESGLKRPRVANTRRAQVRIVGDNAPQICRVLLGGVRRPWRRRNWASSQFLVPSSQSPLGETLQFAEDDVVGVGVGEELA